MHSTILSELLSRLPAAAAAWVYCGVLGLAAAWGTGNTPLRAISAAAAVLGSLAVFVVWWRAGVRAIGDSPGDLRVIRSGRCAKCGHDRGRGLVCMECGDRVPRVTG